jgi:hypothetical protein
MRSALSSLVVRRRESAFSKTMRPMMWDITARSVSDEAIQCRHLALDCFASLAMTLEKQLVDNA